MMSDGKPYSHAVKKKHKSNGSLKRSQERIIKYRNNNKKEPEQENNWRKNKSNKKDKVKTSEKPCEVAEEKLSFSESVFVCD